MSFRYPAGLITAGSPVVPQYPTGVWTNQQAAPYIQNNVWGVDSEFDQTVLLLHGDGTNGAQNNTFLDSSTNNFTITRNGNTTQGTFTPFSKPDGRWGNYFDGTGDYLSLASNSAFALGTGDFTMECWAYYSSFTREDALALANWDGATWGANKWSLHLDHVTQRYKISFWVNNINSGSPILLSTTTIQLNTWYHIAVTRSGSTWRLFVNGVQEASTTSSTSIDGGNNSPIYVGGATIASQVFNGYLSNARLVKGTAVYTSNFTPPTAPLTAISGTSLLTCQSNRFIDNSSNNFAITRNGDVKVTPFSPFPTLTAYDAATNGGSGYFDGSGDYLSVPQNNVFAFGTGDFTVEAWIYISGNAAANPGGNRTATILSTQSDNTGWDFFLGGNSTTTGTGLIFSNRVDSNLAYTLSVTTTINQQSWHHVAVVRSGTTTTMYLNGVNVGDTTLTEQNIDIDKDLWIARNGFTSYPKEFLGYISNARVVKGTAVYTSNFTPPTSPVTAITNTSLLCNFTNAGILDNSMSNNLETVGNAQIDTTTKKYGTGSMEFDGTGDALHIVSNPALYLSTGNFTIEGWVYTTTATTSQTIMVRRASQTARGFVIGISNLVSGKLSFVCGDTDTTAWEVQLDSTTSVANNTWYHFAVVRDGNDFELFINGISEDTATSSVVIADDTSLLRIGLNDVGTNGLNGFIDDLRITKGVARYTTNFTPPIARFPNQ